MSASAAAEGSRRSRPSDELVLEFQECFAFFDRDRDGFLTSAEFCEAVRALGHAPTDAELAALQRTVDRIYSSKLSFSNFIKILSTIVQPKLKQPSETGGAMLKAFQEFETICRGREDGTISSADLEKLLTRHGDAIERDSYSQFLQFCGVESHLPTDRIDYAPLVDTLTSAARAANS